MITWGPHGICASTVACCLQHYAVKTIENVVSQGGEWAARFASEEVAADLLSIWVTNRRCGPTACCPAINDDGARQCKPLCTSIHQTLLAVLLCNIAVECEYGVDMCNVAAFDA